MADFVLKQNDTRPKLIATLAQSVLGSVQPIILTGSTVKFLMRVGTGAPKVNRAATITDAPNGIVTFTWQTGDTDAVGTFQGEFQITYSDGGIETVPNNGYLSIEVFDDIGD